MQCSPISPRDGEKHQYTGPFPVIYTSNDDNDLSPIAASAEQRNIVTRFNVCVFLVNLASPLHFSQDNVQVYQQQFSPIREKFDETVFLQCRPSGERLANWSQSDQGSSRSVSPALSRKSTPQRVSWNRLFSLSGKCTLFST